MAFFNPAALIVGPEDKRLKRDEEAQGSFGSLTELIASNPVIAARLEASGLNVKSLQGAREASEAFASSEGAEIKSLLEVRSRIESGEDLISRTNKRRMKAINKIFGDRAEAEKAAIREIDGIISRKLIGVAQVRNELMSPNREALKAVFRLAQDIDDTATRNKLADDTEAYLRLNPEEGRVIPWMMEAYRLGQEGAFFEEAIDDPFVDEFFKDPAAVNSFGDSMFDMGIRSVDELGNVNAEMDVFMEEVFPNIPGITKNAVEMAKANYHAAQAQRQSIIKKEAIEEAEEKGFEGKDFATTDMGTRHTSTDSTHWRVDAENDFEKFRMFVALQEFGIVTRQTEFSDDWDPMQALNILRAQGATIADIKENRDLWRVATARALDFYSGSFHTPHLFGFVGAKDPPLLEELKQDPDLRKIIGLEHMPVGSFLGGAEVDQIDLKRKREDLANFLKELDERSEPE